MSEQFALCWLLGVGVLAFWCTVVGYHRKQVAVDAAAMILWCIACAPVCWLILPAVLHSIAGGRK